MIKLINLIPIISMVVISIFVLLYITDKKDPLPDHKSHSGEEGRLEKYFRDK